MTESPEALSALKRIANALDRISDTLTDINYRQQEIAER